MNAVNDTISSTELTSPWDLEVLIINVVSKCVITIIMYSVYPTICHGPRSFTANHNYLTFLVSSVANHVIVGYFNFPDMVFSYRHYLSLKRVYDFVFATNLTQVIHHMGGNTLDLIFTAAEISFVTFKCTPTLYWHFILIIS